MTSKTVTALALAGLLCAGSSPVLAQHAPAADVVEIPLQMVSGRLVVPVVAPDGSEFLFALTTGNPMTILSESTAQLLGDQREGLTLGGLPIKMENDVVLPDRQFTEIDGMVGGNTLSDFDILIDMPGERLLLKPVGREVSWAGVELSEPTRLQLYHGVVIGLQVKLGVVDYRATLDIGTPALIVNRPVADRLELSEEDVGTLTLGPTTMSDLPVRVQDLEIFKQWDPNTTGFVLVGAPIAYECAISISWLHQELRTCVK